MDPLILGIETATTICSVALQEGERFLGSHTLAVPRAHGAHLAGMLRDLLNRLDRRAAALDVVAVSAGPGSYTGLRIGVSTAKGLVYASGAALVGISTPRALAASVAPLLPPGSIVLTAVPSRRKEIYLAAFEVDAVGPPKSLLAPVSVRLDALSERLPDPGGRAVYVVGEAAAAAARAAGMPEGMNVAPASAHAYDARWVARLGLEQFRSGRIEDAAAFEPAYINAFVAKRGGSAFDRLPAMDPLEQS